MQQRKSSATTKKPVGTSLLAMAVGQAIQGEWAGLFAGKPGYHSDCGQRHRYSGSHRTCGNELARDGGGSGNTSGEWAGLIAGKPGSYSDCGQRRRYSGSHKTCGSELARDGGGSVNTSGEWAGLIASRPAPTVIWATPQMFRQPQTLWERACSRWRWLRQYRVNGPASSRASPAPTVILCNAADIQAATNPVGASLLAMAVGQSIHLVNGLASSRAGPLPQ